MEQLCYSRLNGILSKREISVIELYRQLKKNKIHVNIKSLYRLNNPLLPIEKINTKIAGQICDLLKIDLSSLFIFRPKLDLTRMRSLSSDKQSRLDILLDKNRERRISQVEELELKTLIEETEQLMLLNAQILAEQRKNLERASSIESDPVNYKQRQK